MQSFIYMGNMRAGTQLANKLIDAGFQAATEIESADYVLTYLPLNRDQEDVYFGTDGIIARANPGTVVVDLSPTTPTFARELYTMAAVNDIHMVEAPLIVSDLTLPDAFSKPGNLTLFVAGESADVTAASVLLDALSPNQQLCGTAGKGQLARCVATLTRISQAIAFLEAYSLVNISPDGDFDLFLSTLDTLKTPEWLIRLVQAMHDCQFQGSYTVEMANGEVASALDASEEEGLRLPFVETSEALLNLLSEVNGRDMSLAALYLHYVSEEESERYGLDWSKVDDYFDDIHDHDFDEDLDDDEIADFVNNDFMNFIYNTIAQDAFTNFDDDYLDEDTDFDDDLNEDDDEEE